MVHIGNRFVSRWPVFFPKKKRERNLACLVPTQDGYTLLCKSGEIFDINSWESLRFIISLYNLEVHVFKIVGFKYLCDAAADEHATVHIVTSSKSPGLITIRSGHKQHKIVDTLTWGYKKIPGLSYLNALANIYERFDYGVHPTPASLGHSCIVESLKEQGEKRYRRPSEMLRDKFYRFGSGGRADDKHLLEEYDIAYESDFDNFYAKIAREGVPVDHYVCFGMENYFQYDISELDKYCVSFVQARITIPWWNGQRKFSPFYIRDEHDALKWVTKPGTYVGYWWSFMLKACVEAGYIVEISSGWVWQELDQFLDPFIEEVVRLRDEFKMDELFLEAKMTKNMLVASFGKFGMRTYHYELVTQENRRVGDEEFLDMHCTPSKCSPRTGYYLRRKDEKNAPYLTQVNYYIVAKGNFELYERCIAEERNGNEVIMTNFDSLTTVNPPTLDMTGLKLKTYHHFKPQGLRSFKHDDGETLPGVKEESPIRAFTLDGERKKDERVFRTGSEIGSNEDILCRRMGKRGRNITGAIGELGRGISVLHNTSDKPP